MKTEIKILLLALIVGSLALVEHSEAAVDCPFYLKQTKQASRRINKEFNQVVKMFKDEGVDIPKEIKILETLTDHWQFKYIPLEESANVVGVALRECSAIVLVSKNRFSGESADARKLIIIHEIAHMLGINHSEGDEHHIMNPSSDYFAKRDYLSTPEFKNAWKHLIEEIRNK